MIEQYKKGTQTAYVENDPVTGQPLMLRTSSGTAALYIYDGTGNPAALLTDGPNTAFAYQYDPYGVPTLTEDSGGLGTTQNPYTFKTGIQDRVTGWVKYGQRWYSPTTGRWTQQDTLDAPLNPANANRYAYAANDPINNSDPTGLNFWSDFGDTFAPFVIGGAIIGLGAVATLAIKGTGVGLAVTAGIGCAAGLASTAVGDGRTGNDSGVGGYAGACIGGAAAGAFGFGLGKLGAAAIK